MPDEAYPYSIYGTGRKNNTIPKMRVYSAIYPSLGKDVENKCLINAILFLNSENVRHTYSSLADLIAIPLSAILCFGKNV